MGVTSVPSVGRAQFELFLPLPTVIGMALSEVVVLVSTWATGEAPMPAGEAVYLATSVEMGVDNSRSSG